MTELSNKTFQLNERIEMISVSNSCSVAIASESNELVRLYRINDNEKFGECQLVTKSVGSTDAIAMNPNGTILCCSGK